MAPTLLTAPNISAKHGFTTRAGGVSGGVYESLNLGLSTGDERGLVEVNRNRVIAAFGASRAQVVALEQVHGARIIVAEPSWYEVQGDAAVTDDPKLLLVISTADCAPLLFHDPMKNVVGAAHAGWRGTVKQIAAEVVRKLEAQYGSCPQDIRVAIGPSIQAPCYQVGPEVVDEFAEAGFPDTIYSPDDEGRYRLDVAGANRFVLEQTGVPAKNIYDLGDCTHCDAVRFYSHRRDALKRGSHWALIRLGAS